MASQRNGLLMEIVCGKTRAYGAKTLLAAKKVAVICLHFSLFFFFFLFSMLPEQRQELETEENHRDTLAHASEHVPLACWSHILPEGYIWEKMDGKYESGWWLCFSTSGCSTGIVPLGQKIGTRSRIASHGWYYNIITDQFSLMLYFKPSKLVQSSCTVQSSLSDLTLRVKKEATKWNWRSDRSAEDQWLFFIATFHLWW